MVAGLIAKRVVGNGQQALMKVQVRTIYPHMNGNHIAGMPRVRFPFWEKVAGGLFIASCILATPAWVLTHMDNYRSPK